MEDKLAISAKELAALLDISERHVCRRSEEMGPVLPRNLFVTQETQVCLVHEGCGLERVVRSLARHASLGLPLELIVNQWQELIGRAGVTAFDGGENARNVTHGVYSGSNLGT